MLNLSFSQLLDEVKFQSLKKGFLKQDMKFSISTDESEIDTTEDNISYYKEIVVKTYTGKDPFGFDENFYDTEIELCTLNFYSDFLYPAIKNMLNIYKMKFENDLHSKNIWGDSEIENFCSFQMKNVEDLKIKLQLSKHLTPEVIWRINDVLNEIYLFISFKQKKKHLPLENKIRLNISRIDTVLFFYLLTTNGYISSSLLEVSDFITKNFVYYDKSQDIFKEFTGTKGLVRKIRGGSSLDKSLQHIRAIFKSDDFYNCV